MDFNIESLAIQNPWWKSPKSIEKDVVIGELRKKHYIWHPKLLSELHLDQDVIYTVRGPRQVGKTTLIKTIIRNLLKEISPENIFFWSAERNTGEELNRVLSTYFSWKRKNGRRYIFIDEICAVDNWTRELLHFANRGDLKGCTVIVSGSHALDMKKMTEMLPGRRGGGDNESLDKVLLPMNFRDYVGMLDNSVKGFLEEHGIPDMKNNILEELMSGRIPEEIITASIVKGELDRHFEDYLLTGGIPAVVDAYHTRNKIPTRYYSLYLNATIGDVKRSRLRETYFKQVASRVLKSISDPISWESVTRTTDIKHHETVAQYMETLEALYIANVTLKVNADGRPSIRSNKKVYFQDPFITHSLQWWMKPAENPLVLSREWVLDPVRRGHLVEGVVNDHLIRYSYDTYPSDLFDAKDFVFYYRTKSGKEIDFILNRNTGLYPIEVKYRRKANGYDLIPLRSFGRGLVLTRNTLDVRKGFVHIPVSMFLMLI